MGRSVATGSGRVWTPSGLLYNDARWSQNPGDRPPLVASAYDDEFQDASIDAKWSWLNQGSATITEVDGIEKLVMPADAATNIRGREQTFTQANAFLQVKMRPAYPQDASINNTSGLYFRNSTSGKLLTLYYSSNNTAAAFVFARWNSTTSFSATVTTSTIPAGVDGTVYLGLKLVGSTVSWWYSPNGAAWAQFTATTEALATFVSSVNRIGFFSFISSSSGLGHEVDVEWFRVS